MRTEASGSPSIGCRSTGSSCSAGVAVIAIQAAIPYVPILATAFHATPLDTGDWVIVGIIALIPALVAETVRTVTGRTWIA